MQAKFIILTIIAFAIGQTSAQDTVKTIKDWRLFPAKNIAAKQVSDTTIKLNKLDYNRPDGEMNINQDARIVGLGNELKNAPYIYGYTLQLEVSQQKSVIKDARYKIMKIEPDIELDDPYEAPNMYLYAGRFYDRTSAYQFKNEISKYFPNAIVVGPRKMDLPAMKMPEPIVSPSDSTEVKGLEGGIDG